MKNLCLFIAIILFTTAGTVASNVDSLTYGIFGKVYIYKPKVKPEALVLFVSGDGGWNAGPINMCKHLVDQGAMVVGVNISRYMTNKMNRHEKCYYPAGDFEELSLYIQKKYRFKNYLKPILIGYSSGATLVYGILAQAPANTFKGAIAMGFCPDIASVEPLCATNALKQHPLKSGGHIWLLEPTENLTAPFIAINGLDDKICDFKDTEAFFKKLNNAELIGLPKVGHGMSVQKNYLPHLIYAYNKVKNAVAYTELLSAKNQQPNPRHNTESTSELPLIVLPVSKMDTMPVVVFISGDGGWTSFDEGVAEKLVARGIPVIGLDAQKYFWQARTPEETTAELSKVINQYLRAWNKKSFILCGFSFGADIIPFMITRMPVDLKFMMKSAVMMSPDPKADFEIHVADMLSFGSKNDTYDVTSELKKSATNRSICIFGKDEDNEIPKLFRSTGAIIRFLPGSHHYNNDFNAVANEIINSTSR
jgi:type IV secretory pathway VirJ component